MNKTSPLLAFALVSALCGAPAFAQEQDTAKPDSIVLESKVGSVMTSTGGAYQTALQGKPLVIGESMMLTDGATATVAYYYDNGNRKCVEKYDGPNTFVIDDSCKKAAWLNDGSSTGAGKSAAIIVGAGLIGAAILESMDKVPVGPLSTGPNGTIRHL